MAKTPKKAKEPKAVGCSNCNPCDDQNGLVVCMGGQLTVFPWPTTGGPFTVIIDPNSETPVQYPDAAQTPPAPPVASPAVPPGDGTGCDNL